MITDIIAINKFTFLSDDIIWVNMPNMRTKRPPPSYSSFFDYWLVNIATSHSYSLHKGYHRTCQNVNCRSERPKEVIGANLICSNRDIHLVVVAPLCRDCNNPTLGELIEFPVDMPLVVYVEEEFDQMRRNR